MLISASSLQYSLFHILPPMSHPSSSPCEVCLLPPFDTACVNPDLNCSPIIAKFSLQTPIPAPPSLAQSDADAVCQLRACSSALERVVDACLRMTGNLEEGEVGARNLDSCYVSLAGAEQCLVRIAQHRCAYGQAGGLPQANVKARCTLLSMMGGADESGEGAWWFASDDADVVKDIMPTVFGSGHEYVGNYHAV